MFARMSINDCTCLRGLGTVCRQPRSGLSNPRVSKSGLGTPTVLMYTVYCMI